jgi:hypothetical protein
MYLEGHAVYLIQPEVATVILLISLPVTNTFSARSPPNSKQSYHQHSSTPPFASLPNASELSDFFSVETAGAD